MNIYLGEGLDSVDEDKGFAEMGKIHFQLPAVATSLKALDSQVFRQHLLNSETRSSMSPSGWWRGAGSFSTSGILNDRVVDKCESLMMLVASTAALERSFSSFANIITTTRNGLSVEKARKLAVVNKILAVPPEDVYFFQDVEVVE